MNKLAVFTLLGTLIAVSDASTTTHRPHTTREPTESESFSFVYTHSHNLIIHSGHKCYVVTLTADEQGAVHTDSGLRAIEIKFLAILATATSTTMQALTTQDVHACGQHITNYYTIP